MKQLNDKIITWLKHHNIDKLSPNKQYLKIVEEVGELARGLLKNDLEAIKDAIGDIYVALMGYSLQHDIQEVYVKNEEFRRGSHTLSSLKSFLYVLYDKSLNPSFYDFRTLITYIDLIAYNNNLTLKECVSHAYNELKIEKLKLRMELQLRMIKFRVWDQRYNKYLERFRVDNLLVVALKDYQVEQFTGLTDKNGKDIYVGDIVYYARDDENYLIGYDIGNAMYSISNCHETMNFDNLYGTELEVIGNINENKELLE